jgi:hypothetical protein
MICKDDYVINYKAGEDSCAVFGGTISGFLIEYLRKTTGYFRIDGNTTEIKTSQL